MTITYILEGNNGVNSGCTPALGTNKDAPLTQTGANQISRAVPFGVSDEITFSWTTVVNQPNSAAWPFGSYNSSVNVNSAGANLTYKHQLHRVNSDCATQEILGTSTSQSGTGVKTFALDGLSPASGSAGDRYQLRMLGSSSSSHGSDAFRITPTVPAENFIDGPWTPPTVGHDYLAELPGRLARTRLRRM